ncbi:MAG TPA: low-specificity L-threonine aldolase [Thermomicrobiaceae bacterium]|nr:low-specificity L-threonine aldolase [Thermomicrobiaceae bacterium]
MIDLRSDTVTRPTPAMRRAMAEAEVGDDQYGEDPTVRRLEELAAEMLGKEAAVYVASGTMGNLVALLTHCGRGDEVILGDESHILWFENGGGAALGGLPYYTIHNGRLGEFDLDEVDRAIRPVRSGYPRTGVVCVENTQNRCGGTVLGPDYLRDLQTLAHGRDVAVHMDGARIFNAAAALGLPARALAIHADSVQFCLSKGLAAPVGSILTGSREFIEGARRNRKTLGGAMRQAGVIAAAGIVALTEMVERLPEDHRRARRLAEGLDELPGFSVDLDTVQSNIVIFQTQPTVSHPIFVERMKERGVLISNYGHRGLRMVTHYEVDDAAVDSALQAAASVMRG